jgi:guanylate kinase
MNAANKNGKLVILSGPSGVGKSTICRQVVGQLGAYLSISATTRPRGAAESDGKDYFFLSPQEFNLRLAQDEFLEHADVFGNFYGTPRTPVEKAMAEGRVVILEIDVQGAMQVKAKMPEAAMIFILPPRPEELQKRLEARARGEDEETRKKRLAKAEAEIAIARQQYDYFVVNEVLDKAVQDVITIIQGHENP